MLTALDYSDWLIFLNFFLLKLACKYAINTESKPILPKITVSEVWLFRAMESDINTITLMVPVKSAGNVNNRQGKLKLV